MVGSFARGVFDAKVINNKILQRFNISPTARALTPAIYTPPSYGNPSQKPACDTTAPLDPDDVKTLQEQVGSLLYYARIVDPTILPAVTTISLLVISITTVVAVKRKSISRVL